MDTAPVAPQAQAQTPRAFFMAQQSPSNMTEGSMADLRGRGALAGGSNGNGNGNGDRNALADDVGGGDPSEGPTRFGFGYGGSDAEDGKSGGEAPKLFTQSPIKTPSEPASPPPGRAGRISLSSTKRAVAIDEDFGGEGDGDVDGDVDDDDAHLPYDEDHTFSPSSLGLEVARRNRERRNQSELTLLNKDIFKARDSKVSLGLDSAKFNSDEEFDGLAEGGNARGRKMQGEKGRRGRRRSKKDSVRLIGAFNANTLSSVEAEEDEAGDDRLSKLLADRRRGYSVSSDDNRRMLPHGTMSTASADSFDDHRSISKDTLVNVEAQLASRIRRIHAAHSRSDSHAPRRSSEAKEGDGDHVDVDVDGDGDHVDAHAEDGGLPAALSRRESGASRIGGHRSTEASSYFKANSKKLAQHLRVASERIERLEQDNDEERITRARLEHEKQLLQKKLELLMQTTSKLNSQLDSAQKQRTSAIAEVQKLDQSKKSLESLLLRQTERVRDLADENKYLKKDQEQQTGELRRLMTARSPTWTPKKLKLAGGDGDGDGQAAPGSFLSRTATSASGRTMKRMMTRKKKQKKKQSGRAGEGNSLTSPSSEEDGRGPRRRDASGPKAERPRAAGIGRVVSSRAGGGGSRKDMRRRSVSMSKLPTLTAISKRKVLMNQMARAKRRSLDRKKMRRSSGGADGGGPHGGGEGFATPPRRDGRGPAPLLQISPVGKEATWNYGRQLVRWSLAAPTPGTPMTSMTQSSLFCGEGKAEGKGGGAADGGEGEDEGIARRGSFLSFSRSINEGEDGTSEDEIGESLEEAFGEARVWGLGGEAERMQLSLRTRRSRVPGLKSLGYEKMQDLSGSGAVERTIEAMPEEMILSLFRKLRTIEEAGIAARRQREQGGGWKVLANIRGREPYPWKPVTFLAKAVLRATYKGCRSTARYIYSCGAGTTEAVKSTVSTAVGTGLLLTWLQIRNTRRCIALVDKMLAKQAANLGVMDRIPYREYFESRENSQADTDGGEDAEADRDLEGSGLRIVVDHAVRKERKISSPRMLDGDAMSPTAASGSGSRAGLKDSASVVSRDVTLAELSVRSHSGFWECEYGFEEETLFERGGSQTEDARSVESRSPTMLSLTGILAQAKLNLSPSSMPLERKSPNSKTGGRSLVSAESIKGNGLRSSAGGRVPVESKSPNSKASGIPLSAAENTKGNDLGSPAVENSKDSSV